MSGEPEIIDRERPGVSELKGNLERLDEAAREYERIKKAKARNIWEKRERAYGTAEEIQTANRVLERSLKHARSQTSSQDIQTALNKRSISDFEAARLQQKLDDTVAQIISRDGTERE